MKALIAPNEPVNVGYRVAQVSQAIFEVASPLFWVDCEDNVVADLWYFDPVDSAIKELPVPEPVVMPAPEYIPSADGSPNVIA